MRLAATLTVLAATSAVVLGTVAPAHAATENRTDAANDTVTSFEAGGDTPASIQRAADIRTLKGVHGDGKLTFTFTVADAADPGLFDDLTVSARFVTPTERDFLATFSVSGGQRSVSLTDSSRDATVECDGLTGRIAQARNRYVVSVPRSCVRNPRQVRFGGSVNYFGANGDDVGQAADDARRKGTLGGSIRLGTKQLANN